MSAPPVDDALGRYARRLERAAGAADAAADALTDLDPGAAARLHSAATRARQGRLRVALVGGFSSGKSTLLNALLGAPLLPAKVNPCTAFPVRVSWAPALQIALHPASGDPPLEVDAESFRAAWQLPDGEDDDGRLEAIAHAAVGAPLPVLAHGVELLDSPGLDDDPRRTARTLALLDEADAIVLVIAAPRGLGPLEARLLTDHLRPRGLDDLFFAVTQVDLLARLPGAPSVEARLAQIQEALAPLSPAPLLPVLRQRIFGLDARKAARATASGQGEEADRAGWSAFQAGLSRWLVEERGEPRLAHLRALVGAARAAFVTRRAAALADRAERAEAVEARVRALGPRLDALAEVSLRVRGLVAGRVDLLTDALLDDLAARVREAHGRLPARLAAEAGSALGLLAPGGRERLDARLHTITAETLREAVEAWSVDAGRRTTEAMEGLRAELAAETDRFDAAADAILAEAAGVHLAPPPPRGATPQVGSAERWFATAAGLALLSPGAALAGWTTGYEGALRGAAAQVGVRAVTALIAVVLGPVGWAGLAAALAAEAWLIRGAAGAEHRVARDAAAAEAGIALQRALREERPALHARLTRALAPFAAAVAEAADADARALRAQVDALHADLAAIQADRAATVARFDAALAQLDAALAAFDAP